MVIILYLIAGLLFAIFNHHTVTEFIDKDERVRNGQISEKLANVSMHIAMTFLVLLWPYYVATFIVGFVKRLIKGGNEE